MAHRYHTYAQSYCHIFGFRGRAFRFANVVGPRPTHGVGYDFLRRLRAHPTRLRILGDDSQRKSYIHVDDALAKALSIQAGLATNSPAATVDGRVTSPSSDLIAQGSKRRAGPAVVRFAEAGRNAMSAMLEDLDGQ